MTKMTGDLVINKERRALLKTGGGIGIFALFSAVGLLRPGLALADWNKSAFSAKSLASPG